MSPEKILLGHAWATALENAVAYARCTIFEVRFINNVRVAQIFFGSLNVCRDSFRDIIMMTTGYHGF